MGCDIHAYVEHKHKSLDYWDGWPRINPGRNYELFGYLAGVRGEGPAIVEPRGVPNDPGYHVRSDYWTRIAEDADETGYGVTPDTAKSYVSIGADTCTYGGHDFVSSPDLHTATWLTLNELLVAIRSCDDVDVEYHALAAAMAEFERLGQETRLVIWFDN